MQNRRVEKLEQAGPGQNLATPMYEREGIEVRTEQGSQWESGRHRSLAGRGGGDART
jgi:hypothetical protein